MPTKRQLADTLKERFAGVAERGRVVAQALKMRADIALTRRRLRSTLADLGESIFARMESGSAPELESDPMLSSFHERIAGLKAELKFQETELQQIVQDKKGVGRQGGGEAEDAAGPIED
jgi:hypothetical protein